MTPSPPDPPLPRPDDPAYAPTVRRPGPQPDEPTVTASPGSPAAAMSPPPGERFGKFIRQRKLGSGGMGEVWLGWDVELARPVALKFLKGTDEEELARFRREAQTAARLTHPNIAAIYEVGEEAGRPWIAMQYVDGQTLRTLARDDRRRVVQVVRDAARAVEYANRAGVVHRDLKPENLMVTDGADPRVFVMDFGLARPAEGASDLSVSGQILGTPNYMPPEQARGERVDARADVYSLGATLYELLTDRKPFTGPNVYATLKKVIDDEPEAPRRIDRTIDGDLETIVLKCMEKERERRYGGAGELADDLERWLNGEAIAARPASALYRARKYLRRKMALAVLAVVLLGVAAYSLWATMGPGIAHVLTMPAGAEIEVDGRRTGVRTPGDVRLWPWWVEHSVSARIEGYDAVGQTPEVRAGQTTRVMVELIMTTGDLTVESTPPGAEVEFVKGSQVFLLGRTPLRASVPRGAGMVILRLERHEEVREAVDIPPGGEARVEKLIAPHTGFLSVESDLAGAVAAFAAIDRRDVPAGEFPIPAERYPLPVGRYRVTFGAEGRFPRSREIVVERDGETRARASLNPLETWSVPLASPGAAVSVADFDEDGVWDVAARCADGRLRVVSGRSGAEIWARDEGLDDGGGPHRDPPRIADLDGDAVPDVLVGTRWSTVLALSGRNGATIWEASVEDLPAVALRLADMNGDGVPDAVTAAGRRAVALSGRDGRRLWVFESPSEIESPAAVADADGDGHADALAVTGRELIALSGAGGAPLWRTGIGAGRLLDLADLDGDGAEDAVIGSLREGIEAVSGRDGSSLWVNEALSGVVQSAAVGQGVVLVVTPRNAAALRGADGTIVWQQLADLAGDAEWPRLLAGDLSGDGVPDAVAGPFEGRVCAWSGSDGTPLWSAPPSVRALSGPALADTDGDGVLDAIVGTGDSRAAALSATGGCVAWEAPCGMDDEITANGEDLDRDGTPDVVIARPDGVLTARSGADGARLWQKTAGPGPVDGDGPPDGTLVSADLDGDGRPEVIVVSAEGLMALSGLPGHLLWVRATEGEFHHPLPCDLDGDGRPEILALSLMAPAGESALHVLRGTDGTVLRRFDLPPARYAALAVLGRAPAARVAVPLLEGIRVLAIVPGAALTPAPVPSWTPAPLAAAAAAIRDARRTESVPAAVAARLATLLPGQRDKDARFLLLYAVADASLAAGDRAAAGSALDALADLGADSWLLRAGLAASRDSLADLSAALRLDPDAAASWLSARAEPDALAALAANAAPSLSGLPRAAARILSRDWDLALAGLRSAELAGRDSSRIARLRALIPAAAAPFLERARKLEARPSRAATLALLARARASGGAFAEATDPAATALDRQGKKAEALKLLEDALSRNDLPAESRGELEARLRALK